MKFEKEFYEEGFRDGIRVTTIIFFIIIGISLVFVKCCHAATKPSPTVDLNAQYDYFYDTMRDLQAKQQAAADKHQLDDNDTYTNCPGCPR